MDKFIQTTQAFRQDLSVFGPVFNSDFTLKKQTDNYYGFSIKSMHTLCLLLTLTKFSGILRDTGFFHFLKLNTDHLFSFLSTLLEEYPKIYRAP